MNIVVAILIFSIIIIFHELGHFTLAKLNGIRVNEFALGLGPTIFGITRGETKYCLKLFPFGGLCAMEGEGEESDDDRSFQKKSVWARISVVIAGPVFNFIMAFVFSIILVGSIGYDSPMVSGVLEGYSAEEAGLQSGDVIKELGNKNIHFFREISFYNIAHAGEATDVVYEREGKEYKTTLNPVYDEDEGRYLMGISSNGERIRLGVLGTVQYATYEVKYWIETTFTSLRMLVTGKVSANDLSGPIGIVKVIGSTYTQSKSSGTFMVFLQMLNISILLSANLGVMNLLPIPALDGGRLFLYIIEVIRRKPISPTKENVINAIGFMFLMVLMVVIMFNDIRKLF